MEAIIDVNGKLGSIDEIIAKQQELGILAKEKGVPVEQVIEEKQLTDEERKALNEQRQEALRLHRIQVDEYDRIIDERLACINEEFKDKTREEAQAIVNDFRFRVLLGAVYQSDKNVFDSMSAEDLYKLDPSYVLGFLEQGNVFVQQDTTSDWAYARVPLIGGFTIITDYTKELVAIRLIALTRLNDYIHAMTLDKFLMKKWASLSEDNEKQQQAYYQQVAEAAGINLEKADKLYEEAVQAMIDNVTDVQRDAVVDIEVNPSDMLEEEGCGEGCNCK